nr:pyridoxamine 5'-phosphate oxidase family protein [Brucella intermedia]
MKSFLAKQLPIQATVSKDGLPDSGPKRSLRVYDDTTLIYNENTGGQTLQNIRDGSKIAIAIIDREALDGYRFVGQPEVFTEGSPFENALAFAEKAGMKPPKCAVLISIEEISHYARGRPLGLNYKPSSHIENRKCTRVKKQSRPLSCSANLLFSSIITRCGALEKYVRTSYLAISNTSCHPMGTRYLANLNATEASRLPDPVSPESASWPVGVNPPG